MFHVPEKHRVKNHPLIPSTSLDGNNGFFIIPHYKIQNYYLIIQASDGMGWEHVSVSVGEKGKKQNRCPTWGEMCWVKDQFWDDTDCVIQYHPVKKEYVNMHPYVLHLWKPIGVELPTPESIMVGVNIK